jgi:hypothetical protein
MDDYVARRVRMTRLGIKIGKLTNFGLLGFDARSMEYDPRDAIQSFDRPAQFVYAEHDILVTPSINIVRMREIFRNDIPQYIDVAVIDRATHSFTLMDNPYDAGNKPADLAQSSQLVDVLNAWLDKRGF